MVGLVHVVLAIILVSFTKTLSGDIHVNLRGPESLKKNKFGFIELISNLKINETLF